MKSIYLSIITLILSSAFLQAKLVSPTDDLQAVLDSGEDLAFQKGVTYEIKATLQVKKENQKIYTEGAVTMGDYARLKIVSPEISRILNGSHKKGLSIKNVIFDGNRYAPRDIKNRDSLVQIGSRGGDEQTVQDCVFLNGRGWSLLHIFEPAKNITLKGNFLFGSGVDCRGGGASQTEEPFPWGDGISLASSDSLVQSNLMIDCTDVGLVVFCSPNSLIEENVSASISREPLGGINMVDSTTYYENPKGSKRWNYTGLVVRNNLVDAKGARIHIAIPIGKHTWGPGPGPAGKSGIIVEGGTVENNVLEGKCMGYGFAMMGAENFVVKNNISKANYSRAGDGLHYKKTDEPTAFIYDPETVKNCDIQKEFKPVESNMIHLLACNFGKRRNEGKGFRMYPYGTAEGIGVCQTAFQEMLGRLPNEKELEENTLWLDEEKLPADALRQKLMASNEFTRKYGKIAPENLQEFRTTKWLETIDAVQKDYLKKNKTLPSAKVLYKNTWDKISTSKNAKR